MHAKLSSKRNQRSAGQELQLQLQQLTIRSLLKLSICTPADGSKRLHWEKFDLVR